tara:strand:+ start:11101 stop:11583 length:483 start_codon:yes stop_codon:yes gene_type:complete
VKIKQCNPSRRHGVIFSLMLLLSASVGLTGGCQLFNEQQTAPPHTPYPEDMALGEVFDIQVFRDVTELRFTNTSTHTFPDSTVWINKRYSLAIPGFAPGETVTLDLRNFVDEFGDVYRAGGFFAQRTPAPVVLVQLETGETNTDGEPVLFGLVVVENKFD